MGTKKLSNVSKKNAAKGAAGVVLNEMHVSGEIQPFKSSANVDVFETSNNVDKLHDVVGRVIKQSFASLLDLQREITELSEKLKQLREDYALECRDAANDAKRVLLENQEIKNAVPSSWVYKKIHEENAQLDKVFTTTPSEGAKRFSDEGKVWYYRTCCNTYSDVILAFTSSVRYYDYLQRYRQNPILSDTKKTARTQIECLAKAGVPAWSYYLNAATLKKDDGSIVVLFTNERIQELIAAVSPALVIDFDN